MKKETRITAPDGCEIEKVELIDGVAVVTFKEKERKLPKSWKEFCSDFQMRPCECYIDKMSNIIEYGMHEDRATNTDKNVLPDRATAEAVLALCQLIQLRNCYNGDWVPDWTDNKQPKYIISFAHGMTDIGIVFEISYSPLYFKTEDLRDEFLRCFRPLIEKLKPLYGIKEGGEE